jgi:hypothetical protein
MKVIVTKEFLSGALFVALGLIAVIVAHGYRMGTAMQMGPGYFPTLIGGLVAVIGVIVAVKALLWPDQTEAITTWEIRPLIFILAAILAFGALVDTHGLIAALVALAVIGRLAGREGSMIELAIMVVVICAVAVGIFVYGLHMPFQLGLN